MLIFNTEVKGITDDSRKVKKGFLFVAVKGITNDGHKFIPQAVANGAKLVVGQENLKIKGAKYIQVKDSREELGILASEFYGNPSKKLKVIGVTGTDGKTTTSNLIYWILKSARKKVGLISTINAKIGDKEYDTGFHVTNPEPVMLQKFLSDMVKTKCEYAVLEVTSHGLDQRRVAGVQFYAGVLTNITHEHLDYHKTFERYLEAKGKLFKDIKYAVLNGNNKSSAQIYPYVNKKARVLLYSPDLLDKELKNAVTNRFPEKYNQENATAAIATTRILGLNKKVILKAISAFPQLAGRMEMIENDKGLQIYVDFAHTPNALENVLTVLNKQVYHSDKQKKGKLICVFGCAGERDAKKRPMMGEISTRIADVSIFTAEDPRSENVRQIVKEMKKGVKNSKALVYEILERGEAISFAINKIAKKNDIVVICGKGHEKSMAYGKTEYPWSDQEAVKKALKGEVLKIK